MKRILLIKLKGYKEINWTLIRNLIQFYLQTKKKIKIKVLMKYQEFWTSKQLNRKIKNYLKECRLSMDISNLMWKECQLDLLLRVKTINMIQIIILIYLMTRFSLRHQNFKKNKIWANSLKIWKFQKPIRITIKYQNLSFLINQT